MIVKTNSQEESAEKEGKTTEKAMVTTVLEEKEDRITKTAPIVPEEKIDKIREKVTVTAIVQDRRTERAGEVRTEGEEEEMIEIVVYSLNSNIIN